MAASNLQKEPDILRRRVLFAVGLIDPLTGQLVSSGMKVSLDELLRRPIVNRSGYFVWLVEGDARPSTVTVVPAGAPYERETVAVGPLPAPPPEDPSLPIDPADAPKRRLHIFLRPTGAYPFPDGAIVVRGKLTETAAQNAPAVKNARIGLEWKAESQQNTNAPAVANWKRSPAAAATSDRGEFAAALALPPGARPEKTATKTIALRLRCDRAGVVRVGGEFALPPAPDAEIISERNTYFLETPVAWNQLQAP
jgi:hypothetical protein